MTSHPRSGVHTGYVSLIGDDNGIGITSPNTSPLGVCQSHGIGIGDVFHGRLAWPHSCSDPPSWKEHDIHGIVTYIHLMKMTPTGNYSSVMDGLGRWFGNDVDSKATLF